MRAVRAAGALALVLTAVAPVSAQPAPGATGAPSWRPWRPVLSIGAGVLGREALGVVPIETRAATVGTRTPPAFTLFRTDSSLGAAVRADVGMALPITPTLGVELIGTAGRRTLSTAITSDAEGAPATTATERVAEYTLGGRIAYALPAGRLGRRVRPFVAAGGAYLRQLHDDNALVDTGSQWGGGIGAHVWLRGAAGAHPMGVTGEVGWQWRSGGIVFDDARRSLPVASVKAFVGL